MVLRTWKAKYTQFEELGKQSILSLRKVGLFPIDNFSNLELSSYPLVVMIQKFTLKRVNDTFAT